MNSTSPKYRRKLNTGQIEVLKLLYKFRFASADLIAQHFGKSGGIFVYKRLKILQEQGYIIQRFNSSYRIKGKPATYCLSPTGGRMLQENTQPDVQINIKALYKNKTNSELFVTRCLDIFAIYNQLKAQYGDALKFFGKSELAAYDYFPKPLPDAYFRLRNENETRQYFLNLCAASQPFFTLARGIKSYIEYADNGDWDATETSLPVMLLVCDSHSLQKRLQKFIASAVEMADDEIKFALTTKPLLTTSDKTAIWQLADEPETIVSLDSIQ